MEEESQEDSDEEERKEGRKSVGRKSPKEPTKLEREEHERTHCPYRSWCHHCVKSRARNGPHRQLKEEPLEEVKVPRVHMDYFFMSRQDEEASNNPLLVVADAAYKANPGAPESLAFRSKSQCWSDPTRQNQRALVYYATCSTMFQISSARSPAARLQQR